MSESDNRIDEVASTYVPARNADHASGILFWLTIPFSLAVLFPDAFSDNVNSVLKTVFLCFSVLLAILFLVTKFWLLPTAERLRRKQLLSDAFGVPLTTKSTSKYYNNGFPPSYERLAAHTMENSFFGMELAAKMLIQQRLKTGGYFFVWMLVLVVRHENIDVVVWVTQLVFSADVLSHYVSLELLRWNHARTYDELHCQFVHKYHKADSAKAIPATLSAFADYECTKARSGILLDSKLFEKENPRLTKEWELICQKLDIPIEPASHVAGISNSTQLTDSGAG